MEELYPPIEPYETGMMDVGDGHRVYWETCGNPRGKPAVVLHGGPGSGCSAGMRRPFDPDRYRVVLFDQRGCGRSVPNAADPTNLLAANTTQHLLRDIESLRTVLGIDRWLVMGGSWGSTLGVAYAEAHPNAVTEAVLCSVTTSSRAELDWLYRGVAVFFPAEWERFRAAAGAGVGENELVKAYSRLMESPDPEIRLRAARSWCAWEDAVISLESNGRQGAYSNRSDRDLEAFVRICAHYFSHFAWLDEGALLRNAPRLARIPGILIHGRLDLSCPIQTAHSLAVAWPGAELIKVGDAGHTGSPSMVDALVRSLNRFAAARS